MKKEPAKRINSTVSFASRQPSFVITYEADGETFIDTTEHVKENEASIVAPLVDLPPPPDGGWGWVIVFASFMCNLILDGIAYTFGVLLGPLVVSFDSNRSTVSWVGSLLAGVYLMSGPIVGGLVNKFGCRPVCIVGSLVACVGLCLSTLSPNVPVLMLTYGVIGGFGLGLIYLPAVVAVGYYFESKRALATGISVCGSGVGTFLFAPLATYLLEQYGWKGSNLIFAGLCLNCAVFGALMRPLELKVKIAEPEDDDVIPEEDEEDDEDEGAFKFRSDTEKPKEMEPLIENVVHILPPITEQSVTKIHKEEHKKITDVFPEQVVSNEDVSQDADSGSSNQVRRPSKRTGSRIRTISENQTLQIPRNDSTSRFQLTPLKKKLGPIPRNSSAPHFIDANKVLPRNVSTPGFGRQISTKSSHEDHHGSNNVLFGIEVGSTTQLSNTQLYLGPRASISRRGSTKQGPLVRPFSRKDLFYGGSVLQLMDNPPDEGSGWDQYRHSIISTPRRLSTAPRNSIVASHLSLSTLPDRKLSSVIDPEGATPIITALKEMVNFNLLINPIFLLVGFSNVFGMLGFYVPFVYLPNMAALRGVSVEDANFLLSVIGISNTIGRVMAGWFSDFSWVDSLLVTNLAILFSGVATFVLPFCTSYGAFVTVALLFGFFVAAYISLTSIVLVDLLGLDNLTSAFGLLVLYRGVSSMVGPPVAGAVYDATQSYDTSFFMAGGFLVVASLISFAAQFLQRRKAASKADVEQKK